MASPGETAAVLTTGTEVARGEIINSNASWLAARLTECGYEVGYHRVVPDDEQAIHDEILALAALCGVVVVTGGLGPTSDDMTTAAIARASQRSLVRSDVAEQHLRRLAASRGRAVTESSLRMADVPDGATLLPNAIGSAYGYAVPFTNPDFVAEVYCLPGVPREMKGIFEDHIEHRIARKKQGAVAYVQTFGAQESLIGEMLADLETAGVALGYRAHVPEVEVKVLVSSDVEAPSEEAARISAIVQQRLGVTVYACGRTSLAGEVLRVCSAQGHTLAIAESCTGGRIGSMLAAVPGASDVFLLDTVTYAVRCKSKVLGVEAELIEREGVVSAAVALAMADGVRRLSGASLAVATTGIAGPGGGTAETPVGTVWIACVSDDLRGALRVSLRGDRESVQIWASHLALDLLLLRARNQAWKPLLEWLSWAQPLWVEG